MTPDWIGAFIIGLLGAGHCIGMCGGIATMLSLSSGSSSIRSRMVILSLYNMGRLTSYVIAGGLIGGTIASLASFTDINNILVWLRLIAGVFMIGLALYLGRWWFGLLYIEKLGQTLWKPIAPIAKTLLPLKNKWHAIYFGMLWGWLPCGLVYSMLTWSAVSGGAINGSLIMLCFGLGTLPAMLLFGVAAEQLKTIQQSDLFRKIAAMIIFIYGVYTLITAVIELI